MFFWRLFFLKRAWMRFDIDAFRHASQRIDIETHRRPFFEKAFFQKQFFPLLEVWAAWGWQVPSPSLYKKSLEAPRLCTLTVWWIGYLNVWMFEMHGAGASRLRSARNLWRGFMAKCMLSRPSGGAKSIVAVQDTSMLLLMFDLWIAWDVWMSAFMNAWASEIYYR